MELNDFKPGDEVVFTDFKLVHKKYSVHDFDSRNIFYKGDGSVEIITENYNARVTIIHDGYVGVEYDGDNGNRCCLGFKPDRIKLKNNWLKSGKPNWKMRYT